MGLKVDMNEVHNMKQSIDSSLDSLNSKVENLNSSMTSLIGTDGFEGKAADSVKNYTKTFHEKNISKIKTINEKYKSDIKKSIDKFESEVDKNSSAILVEDEIKDYKQKIDDTLGDVYKSSDDANNSIMDVADLTTANKIDTTNLANKMATFNKQIDKTLEKLRDFDTNNSIDGDRTNNLIEELSGLNSYVKKLSPNRARISSTSGKIDKARFVHKTSEELIKWQKYMESISDSIEGQPGLNKKYYEVMVQAGREYFVVKAIGDGSVKRGFDKFLKYRDVNKIFNSMNKRQLRRVMTLFNVSKSDIKLKNSFKNASEFVRNNPFKKGNLVNWLSKVQNYDSMNAKVLRESIKNKHFKYQFGDAKKFFDTKEMKKAASTEFKNTFINQGLREAFGNKGTFTISGFKNNFKKYWNKNVRGGVNEFKNKNILGKIGKITKMGGKILKPLAIGSAIMDNYKKDDPQKTFVGSGVDLAAIGASSAAGAAIGTAIPVPVLGTLVGAGVGAIAGLALETKLPFIHKSVTQVAKDGINSGLDNAKDAWKKTTSAFKMNFN